MKAYIKCSNCGEEISNLNLSYGKKSWIIQLLVIPICLIPMFMMMRQFYFKPDRSKCLTLSKITKKIEDGTNIVITGMVTNSSNETWESVQIEAEFFGSNGEFLGEFDKTISADIGPGENEYFKIAPYKIDPEYLKPDSKMVLKISDGRVDIF